MALAQREGDVGTVAGPQVQVGAAEAHRVHVEDDVVGSGTDWPVTTGFSDELSLHLLRSLQRKVLGAVGRAPRPGPTAPDVRR